MTETTAKRDAYRAKEAASRLDIPYRTVMNLIHSGKLGAVLVGRYYIVPQEEIDRLLAPAKKAAA